MKNLIQTLSPRTLSLIAAAALGLAAGSSQAEQWGHPSAFAPNLAQEPIEHDHYDPASIDARQHEQLERIHSGVASGQLSRQEARDLYREEKQIEFTKRSYLADGRLSREEVRDLDRLLDHASADIRREKHDGR